MGHTPVRRRAMPVLMLSRTTQDIAREGLVAMIDRQHDIRIVGEAANGEEAAVLWSKVLPDLP
jgi:chemotaxis response regulator CheB